MGVLYPYSATIREQDTTEPSTRSWRSGQVREAHQTTGTYEEFDGEAPLQFENSIRANRWLELGDDERRYSITSSITDLEGPRVKSHGEAF